MSILNELKGLLNRCIENERRNSLEILDMTPMQADDYFRRQMLMERSRAIDKYNNETDPEKKRKMKALLEAGVYNLDQID